MSTADAMRARLQVNRRGQHFTRAALRRLEAEARDLLSQLAAELIQVRSARDRTKRTIQIGVRSEFLESKENHEKHRREKNHFNEAAVDPKYKKGPHERKEKGNKLH